jgi:glutamyl-tRNA reductase
MSGPIVSRALRERFEAIRRAEIERLTRKLRGLTDDERRSVDAITADVIHAIVSVPERALAAGASQSAAEVLVRLFAL